MRKSVWQLQEAKSRLSELVRAAQDAGPQEITVRGAAAVVVISKAEFERLGRPKPRFVDFIRQSPLSGIDLELQRERTPARDVDL